MKSRILVKLGLPGMVAALSLGLAACGGGGGGGPASETGGDGGTDTPTGTAEKPTVVHISKGAEQLPGGTKVYGKVTSDGGAPLTRAGVCYGLTEETVYGDCIDAAGPKVGEDFSVTLPVAPSKTYYYKPFAENSAGLRGYAEGIGAFVRPEKVTPPPPEVKTGRCLGENSFTPVHAELCGQVLSVGSSESKLTDRGVCWVSASDPNAGDPKPGDGTSACTPFFGGQDLDPFSIWTSATVKDLPNGRWYTYRAYALNSDGVWGYGEVLRFQSPMLRPSLSTVTTQVIKEGFVLRGTVTQYPEGGPSADYYQLTRFRFCWFDDDGDRTCANAKLSQPEPEKHVIHLEYTLGSDQLSPGASYQVQIEVGLGDETMSMMSGPATPLPSL